MVGKSQYVNPNYAVASGSIETTNRLADREMYPDEYGIDLFEEHSYGFPMNDIVE